LSTLGASAKVVEAPNFFLERGDMPMGKKWTVRFPREVGDNGTVLYEQEPTTDENTARALAVMLSVTHGRALIQDHEGLNVLYVKGYEHS